jgi:hypothetical protein
VPPDLETIRRLGRQLQLEYPFLRRIAASGLMPLASCLLSPQLPAVTEPALLLITGIIDQSINPLINLV